MKRKNFSKSESELVDVMDTFQCTISFIKKEIAENPTFLQKEIDTRNTNNVMAALIIRKTFNVKSLQQNRAWQRSVAFQGAFHCEGPCERESLRCSSRMSVSRTQSNDEEIVTTSTLKKQGAMEMIIKGWRTILGSKRARGIMQIGIIVPGMISRAEKRNAIARRTAKKAHLTKPARQSGRRAVVQAGALQGRVGDPDDV